jgi:hypothetical protein
MGTSGSGKTYSSLLLAKGLATDPSKVALIDSENGSGELYSHLYPYAYARILPPFAPSTYVDAIRNAVEAGFEVVIIDSMSHAWKFILNYKETLDGQNRAGGWKNWATVKPMFDELKNAILQAPIHVIVTMRSKAEYAVESVTNARGDTKSEVRKIGTAAIVEPDAEYEFSVVLDVNREHLATTISTGKDRTGLFANEPSFRISEDTGRRLKEWLGDGEPMLTDWENVAASPNPEVAKLEAAALGANAPQQGESPEGAFARANLGSDRYREFASRCTSSSVSWKQVVKDSMRFAAELPDAISPDDVAQLFELMLSSKVEGLDLDEVGASWVASKKPPVETGESEKKPKAGKK